MTRTTYDQILDVAYDRFCNLGLKGLNIEDVTAELGKTKTAFYNFGFPEKKTQLVKDVLARAVEETRQFQLEGKKCTTLAQFKKLLLANEKTGLLAAQMLLLVVDKTTAPYLEEYNKIFRRAAEHEIGLALPGVRKTKQVYNLVIALIRDTLVNYEDKTWQERVENYIMQMKALKRTQ